ncbi:marvel domain-containing protein [Tricladium varicosporioides]|nr:marvel domain-containing protein [Hymenoscyphus varicosporioides]
MIVNLAVRVLQFLFGAVVLVISVLLLKGYGPADPYTNLKAGHAPEEALMGFGTFCGGAGVIIAVIGAASAFLEPLQGLVILILDGVATFFLFAGGVAYAVKVGVGSCGDVRESYDNYIVKHAKLFLPFIYKHIVIDSKTQRYSADEAKTLEDTQGRCRMFQADTAFLWFMFATFAVTLTLTFFQKSGKRGGGIV